MIHRKTIGAAILAVTLTGLAIADDRLAPADDYRKSLDAQKELQKVETDLRAQSAQVNANRKDIGDLRKSVRLLQNDSQNPPQVDVSRFDECPEGNSWYNCSHKAIKDAWYEKEQARLQAGFSQILDDFSKRSDELNKSLENLGKRVDSINKASTDLKAKTDENVTKAKAAARLAYDESAPKTKFGGKVEKNLTGEIKMFETKGGKVNSPPDTKAYPDPKGIRTIGYGMNIDENKGGGLGRRILEEAGYDLKIDTGAQDIKPEDAEKWLKQDIQRATRSAEILLPFAFENLSDVRKRVVVDMIYNMGPGKENDPQQHGFRYFKNLRTAIAAGDYEWAAQEMRKSNWYNDVKPRRADPLIEMMKTNSQPTFDPDK